jgi:hypothetical protein
VRLNAPRVIPPIRVAWVEDIVPTMRALARPPSRSQSSPILNLPRPQIRSKKSRTLVPSLGAVFYFSADRVLPQ